MRYVEARGVCITVMNLRQIFHASFLCNFLAQVSGTTGIARLVLCRRHRHLLKTLVEATCGSRLLQETCTCVGQSCTSFSVTSFLHATEHSSIPAQKLSGT